jgi:hypothetical protein
MSSVTQIQTSNDSAESTRRFFNRFFTESLSYPSNQVDAVIAFFRSRGFDELASNSVSAVLLEQAKKDGVNVFELLDELRSFDKVKLTNLVTAILNANRSKISILGYREDKPSTLTEARNILY